jgi:CCR4-NOT transcription complex subunit 9
MAQDNDADSRSAREALRACLPDALKDGTFAVLLKGDMVTKRCLSTLMGNLAE